MFINNDKNYIGSDETGVGDYLTPLVVCAAFVPKQNVDYMIKIGVDDSKKLSDYQIEKIYEKIKDKIKSSVWYFNQKQYNSLNLKGKYNAHELKWILHKNAIATLEGKVDEIDGIIIDKFASWKNIEKYDERLIEKKYDKNPKIKNKNIILEEKAESKYISVAVASIVARASFLKLLKEQNEKWKTIFPLGTNNKVEEFAKKFVEKNGRDNLNEVAKVSFKTTKKIFGHA